LGINLRKQGQLEKSKLYLKKASDIQPKNAFVFNNLG
jgi:tetratricopeptide (TPR) repeat protein